MLPLEHPDRIHVAFDDHRLVTNAGLLLPASLALRLSLGELGDQHVDLGRPKRPPFCSSGGRCRMSPVSATAHTLAPSLPLSQGAGLQSLLVPPAPNVSP